MQWEQEECFPRGLSASAASLALSWDLPKGQKEEEAVYTGTALSKTLRFLEECLALVLQLLEHVFRIFVVFTMCVWKPRKYNM